MGLTDPSYSLPPPGRPGEMYYRMRIYRAVPEHLGLFHQFFREQLLPVQRRHGARLVGRWEGEDARVVAVWEYDSLEHYERVQASVARDPDSAAAQERRRKLPALFTEQEEVFMRSTVDPSDAEGRSV